MILEPLFICCGICADQRNIEVGSIEEYETAVIAIAVGINHTT